MSLDPEMFPPVKVKETAGDILLLSSVMAEMLRVEEFTASENVRDRIPSSMLRLKLSTFGDVVSKMRLETGMKRPPSE